MKKLCNLKSKGSAKSLLDTTLSVKTRLDVLAGYTGHYAPSGLFMTEYNKPSGLFMGGRVYISRDRRIAAWGPGWCNRGFNKGSVGVGAGYASINAVFHEDYAFFIPPDYMFMSPFLLPTYQYTPNTRDFPTIIDVVQYYEANKCMLTPIKVVL